MNSKTFLSRGGCFSGAGLLVVGGPKKFVEYVAEGYKSHKNKALRCLAGMRGVMRRGQRCFVLDVSKGVGERLLVGTPEELGATTAELNVLTRLGKAWWCKTTNGGGCPSLWVVADEDFARRRDAKSN